MSTFVKWTLLLMPCLVLAGRGAEACPCQDGDVTYSDAAADSCKSELAALAELRRSPPNRASLMASALSAYREQLRDCVAKFERRALEDRARADRERERVASQGRRDAVDVVNRNDGALVRQVLSAGLCVAQEQRLKATRAIAMERRLSTDGLTDDAEMRGFQQALHQADDNLGRVRGQLKKAKLEPLPCTRPEVRALKACAGTQILAVGEASNGNKACQTPEMQASLRLGN